MDYQNFGYELHYCSIALFNNVFKWYFTNKDNVCFSDFLRRMLRTM